MVGYWVTGGLLLVYLVVVWFVPSWLHLHGSDVWILRCGLWLVGLLAAGSFLWFYRKSRASQQGPEADETGGESSKDIDLLLHEATRRLKTSTLGRGASLGTLPLVFLLGEAGAAKTHTILHSALDPELLAGQVFRDNNEVVATRLANIWYSRAAVFVDPAGSLLSQPSRWKRLVRLVQPGRVSSAMGRGQQAPRAALVCVDCENFLRPGAGEATLSMARKLGTRLQEVSQTLSISFPVYVLFTKLDRMSFFLDYVRGLNREEASQILGATLPIRSLDSGVYSEEETKRLNKAFDEIIYSLADRRMELLSREGEADKFPGIYEFPRELRKLRTFAVQFLVEMARPSQLSTNPFLRGFYFSGARPVLVDDIVSAAPMEIQTEDSSPAGATVIFSAKQRPAAAAVQAGGSRKVPQWVFLSQLFNEVLAKDRVALAASGFSSRVSLLRRVGLISAGILALILAVGFIVSFIGNHAIESNVKESVRGLETAGATPAQPASYDDLQKLDRLRKQLLLLSDYEANGVPWHLRWGLYSGDKLFSEAQRVYFARFQQLLLTETQSRMVNDLRGLPDQPAASSDYKQVYEELKAYLITTSNHEKSSADFLPRVLTSVWSAGRDVGQDRNRLAGDQFDYYAKALPSAIFFSKDSNQAAVSHARAYLEKFSGIERYYIPLLGKADQSAAGTSFSEKFPEASGVVSSNHKVRGAFTLAGFKFMDGAIRNPSEAIGGEEWVLGKISASELDPATIQQKLRQRYSDDFGKEWREVLATSHVDGYRDFSDAEQKLEKMTGPASPLLELLWFVSSNTNVSDATVKGQFASAQGIEPPGDPLKRPDQLKGPENASYIQALSDLQAKFYAIAHSPTGPSDQALTTAAIQSAAMAKAAAGQATGAHVDNDYHTENLVRRLLEEPITNAEGLLTRTPKDQLNGAGKQFCEQFAQIAGKYPLNPKSAEDLSPEQFNTIFAPKTGSLWTFYDTAKLSQYVAKQGSGYQSISSGTITINPAFLEFFNRAVAVSETFYPGGSPTPKFSYTLKAMPSNLEGVILKIGNDTLAGAGEQKTFVWTGAPEMVVASTQGGDTLGTFPGTWSIFHFVDDAITNSHSHISGRIGDLEWIMQSNGRPIMLANGKPKSYNYQLQVSGWNPFGSLGLAGMRCEGRVAK